MGLRTGGYSDSVAERWPFRLICCLLLLIATGEWWLFRHRGTWAPDRSTLVPIMLGFGMLKFLIAVGWLMGRVDRLVLAEKLLLLFLAVNGGALLAVALLFSR